MIYAPICGERVSRLGLGTMRLPTQEGSTAVDADAAAALIEFALESGINYFDTGYTYQNGEAERILGSVLQGEKRSQVCLADKYCILTDRDYEKVFEEQTHRLQTDYIDFYMLGSVTDQTADDYLSCGCIDYFLRQKELGRIRHFGFSFHAGLETLQKICGTWDWDFAGLQINYLDGKYAASRAEYEFCSDRGIPVLAMTPLRGGMLARLEEEELQVLRTQHRDWSPASWAIRWFADKRNVRTVIAGAESREQLAELVKAASTTKPLNGPEAMAVHEVCEIIHTKQKKTGI